MRNLSSKPAEAEFHRERAILWSRWGRNVLGMAEVHCRRRGERDPEAGRAVASLADAIAKAAQALHEACSEAARLDGRDCDADGVRKLYAAAEAQWSALLALQAELSHLAPGFPLLFDYPESESPTLLERGAP